MIPYIECFHREHIRKECLDFLSHFEKNVDSNQIHRGLYLYGNHGVGKTEFVKDLLRENNYNMMYINSVDVMNKDTINDILNNHISDKCILSAFQKRKTTVIVFDDIHNTSLVDKTLINNLIKFIRPKKTKKQKLELMTRLPIICINQTSSDKKIKELMKVCCIVHMQDPTPSEMNMFVRLYCKENAIEYDTHSKCIDTIVQTSQNIFKVKMNLDCIKEIMKDPKWKDYKFMYNILIEPILQEKQHQPIRKILHNILDIKHGLDDHLTMMNETDRTSVSLLFHENVIDFLSPEDGLKQYKEIVNHLTYYDFIDRVMFQKQIWILNEITSILKNIKNPDIYHQFSKNKHVHKADYDKLRFTKVLTKYSTEYNNHVFINSICQKLGMDKNEMFIFFQNIRDDSIDYEDFEQKEISKLDVNRVLRFIDAVKTEGEDCDAESETPLKSEKEKKAEISS